MLLFAEVVKVFKEVESKSARLEMTDILAELFKKTDEKEIAKLVYMIQGILAPPYESIDLGMGERFAIDAIASAAGYSKTEVEKSFKKSGDLGDTAYELLGKKKQLSLSSTQMSLEYVFDALLRIAKTSGSGSQEHKIKTLVELLNNSQPLEAVYIIRFVIGSLRLGVGDPTIIDALSVSKTADKTLREPLEYAYNVCSDLGYVAQISYKKPEQIIKFKVQPLKPLMPALAERLNTPKEIIERLGKCGVEMKYDGFRLQCHKSGKNVEIYSRKLEKMTHMFPDVVEAIKALDQKEIIFEGEALACDKKTGKFLPFQQTMQRRRKHGIAAASNDFPLHIFVFDLLYVDGEDISSKNYLERRELIEKIFTSSTLAPSQCKIVESEVELDKIFEESIENGLEGIMAKDLSAPYTPGKRKFAWIKLKKSYGKSVDTIDGVIVGYYLGQGQRAEFEFGGVVVAVYNPERGLFETVAKVASGFSEEEMKAMKELLESTKIAFKPKMLDCILETDFWVEPKYVVEVAFDEITESSMHTCGIKNDKGYALRFPRIVRLRDDKGVKEITTSEEVVKMFELQRSKTARIGDQ